MVPVLLLATLPITLPAPGSSIPVPPLLLAVQPVTVPEEIKMPSACIVASRTPLDQMVSASQIDAIGTRYGAIIGPDIDNPVFGAST